MNPQDKNLLIERYVRGHEDKLIERYIMEGPTSLLEDLGVDDAQWEVIFDCLVFDHNLLYKTVTHSIDFFLEAYILNGIGHVRGILDIEDDKYDAIFMVVKDLIMISHEGLYLHVLENRDRYMTALKARGTDFVRKILGIFDEKYDQSWERVLDILFNAVCEGMFSENTYERGVQHFSLMFNALREHRRIVAAIDFEGR
jgi:hypothetical protein